MNFLEEVRNVAHHFINKIFSLVKENYLRNQSVPTTRTHFVTGSTGVSFWSLSSVCFVLQKEKKWVKFYKKKIKNNIKKTLNVVFS